MTENDLRDYVLIVKEIQILSKELINIKSDYIVKNQDLTEKLYTGALITKSVQDLSEELASIEQNIKQKLHELIKKRAEIEHYINSIQDCEIRLILRLRFIDGMSYANVASELTVTDRNGRSMRNISGDGVSARVSRFFKTQGLK